VVRDGGSSAVRDEVNHLRTESGVLGPAY